MLWVESRRPAERLALPYVTYTPCRHFESLGEIPEPSSKGCDRCIEIGDTWVHLRSCLICGLVGCCDDSKNTHARKHWGEHPDHPLIQSLEPGETWRWCYEDEVGVH